MTRWIPVVVFLLLSSSGAARAQTTVLLLEPASYTPCSGRVTTVDIDRPAILATATAAEGCSFGFDAGGVPYVTPDGGLLVWLRTTQPNEPSTIGVYDLRTGGAAALAAPAGALRLVGHPGQLEVFLNEASRPVALGAAGLRRLGGPVCANASYQPRSISADGTRVLYDCPGSFEAVLDTTTGESVGTVPSSNGTSALGPDGRDVYRVEFVPVGFGTERRLRHYAVATGALLGEVSLGSSFTGGVPVVSVDPRTGQVFVVDTGAKVFDGATLTPVREIAFMPWACQYCFLQGWTLDPTRPRAYAKSRQIQEPGNTFVRYHVFDTETLRETFSTSVSVGGVNSDPGVFLVMPRPPAPTLAGQVSGTSAQLSWVPGVSPTITTRYVLEVGSAPGLSNIFSGLDMGLQTSFSANGVPPGRYYVRVRAGNHGGVSPPSNEIVVQVP